MCWQCLTERSAGEFPLRLQITHVCERARARLLWGFIQAFMNADVHIYLFYFCHYAELETFFQ